MASLPSGPPEPNTLSHILRELGPFSVGVPRAYLSPLHFGPNPISDRHNLDWLREVHDQSPMTYTSPRPIASAISSMPTVARDNLEPGR
jgi:hypothetical protein